MQTVLVLVRMCLLLLSLHVSPALGRSSPVAADSAAVALGSEYAVSLVLLGFTVVLSGIIYLWVLRYICIGCCQPVAVGAEPESLDGMV